MAPYLFRQKVGIPKYEALHIIWAVQLRGCSLRGTPAEAAVIKYLRNKQEATDPDPAFAEMVLDHIRSDDHVARFDTLPPGPCNSN